MIVRERVTEIKHKFNKSLLMFTKGNLKLSTAINKHLNYLCKVWNRVLGIVMERVATVRVRVHVAAKKDLKKTLSL